MSDEIVLTIDPPYIGSAVSPEVDITETDTTYTVDITDFRGVHSYTVEKTDQAIEDAEQAATNANNAASQATATANAAAQYARDTADQAAADAQETADEAAGRADTAAGNATSAAQAATAAAGTANTAAQNADAKAALADSKAALANTAATTANQAALAAEAAKTSANTAAGQATTAATNATTAAGAANTAAGNADAKAALADTAAANADTATQAANNAANVAIEAAEDMPRLIATVGTVQTVNDAWETTMEGATVYGKSVQDGTPTPDNPVPVQVVEPYNLVDMRTQYDNRYFTLSGDTLTNTATDTRNMLQLYVQYYNGNTVAASQFLRNVTTTGKTSYTFTPPTGITYDKIHILHNGATANIVIMQSPVVLDEGASYTLSMDVMGADVKTVGGLVLHGIQLERGTVAHPYTPYGCIGLQTGETVTPIDLQGHGIPEGDLLRVDSTGHVTIEQGETPTIIDLGTIELPELSNPCELAIYASLDPEWAIEYEQDPNAVIAALQSSIAPVEGATASTNYAVNSYLIHANQLYRVTSAIATGEAITPGTNCIACTVMGEVIRLTA